MVLSRSQCHFNARPHRVRRSDPRVPAYGAYFYRSGNHSARKTHYGRRQEYTFKHFSTVSAVLQDSANRDSLQVFIAGAYPNFLEVMIRLVNRENCKGGNFESNLINSLLMADMIKSEKNSRQPHHFHQMAVRAG
jgi:hypothetical protein